MLAPKAARMAKGMDPLGALPSGSDSDADSDDAVPSEAAAKTAPANPTEAKIDYEALRKHGMKTAPTLEGIKDAGGGEDAAESKRPHGKLVQLRYGSYQGMELSAAEVRRIKAEECRALLARRKLQPYSGVVWRGVAGNVASEFTFGAKITCPSFLSAVPSMEAPSPRAKLRHLLALAAEHL